MSDEVTAPVTIAGEGAGSSPAARWSDTTLKAREWLSQNPVSDDDEGAPTESAEKPAESAPNTAPTGTVEPTQAATEEGPLVPSFRLREEADKRRQEAEARQAAERKLEELGPYRGVIETLQARGMTPEQIDRFLAQTQGVEQTQPEKTAEPELSIEERFEAYLTAAGVDPDVAAPETLAALEKAFLAEEKAAAGEARIAALEGRFAEIDHATAQSEQRSIEKSLEAEMIAVSAKFPELDNPDFQAAIYSQFAMEATAEGSTVTLTQVAERFGKSLDAYKQGAIATYATNKKADASVPVVAGGSAAAPVQEGTIYDKGVSRGERVSRIAEFIRTRGANAG